VDEDEDNAEGDRFILLAIPWDHEEDAVEKDEEASSQSVDADRWRVKGNENWTCTGSAEYSLSIT